MTDSNTMIPPARARALGIVVVPLTIRIGDDELVEDDRLDVAAAYRRLRAGEPATTSAPSPGAFAEAYRPLAGPVVSVHIGAAYSATVNAARVGAQASGVAVDVVDTGTASFLAGCCVLAAAEAAAGGADRGAVVAAARRAASSVASVFTIGELGRAAAGGRLDVGRVTEGTPLVQMSAAGAEVVGAVTSVEEAAAAMAGRVRALAGRHRIGVGDADAGPIVDALADELRRARPGDDVLRYVVGPTVAAHAGMGTFGVVYCPLAATSADRAGEE